MKTPVNSQPSAHQAGNGHILALAEQPFVSDITPLAGPVETLAKDGCTKWRSVFDSPVVESEQAS